MLLLLDFLLGLFAFIFVTQIVLPWMFPSRLESFWLFKSEKAPAKPHGLSDLESEVAEASSKRDDANKTVKETLEKVEATEIKAKNLKEKLK